MTILQNMTPFHDKNNKPGTERNLHLRKGIYEKPRANLMFSGESLMLSPVRSETSQRCLLSPLLYSILLEALARATEKELKLYS